MAKELFRAVLQNFNWSVKAFVWRTASEASGWSRRPHKPQPRGPFDILSFEVGDPVVDLLTETATTRRAKAIRPTVVKTCDPLQLDQFQCQIACSRNLSELRATTLPTCPATCLRAGELNL